MIKMVVWDLDNTLWEGSVYYKDKEKVKLKEGSKEVLKELKKREIKNVVCSKNYFEDGEKKLKEFGLLEFFEDLKINWELKSKNVLELMEKFNVSKEEVLFVDDDAFQREEVSLIGVKSLYFEDPLDVLEVDGIKELLEEDRVRLLKEQREREKGEKEHKGDYKEFLKKCEMKMVIREVEDSDWERVVQLLNRTNELNATSNRYKLEELKESYEVNNDRVFVVELKDRFGEYGIIGEAIIDTMNEFWSIRDLTVSCRTMGRGIGGALVVGILKKGKEEKVSKVRGYVKETESNWRMKPLFEKRGFRKVGKKDGIHSYEFDFSEEVMGFPEYLGVEMK
ncbi:hypothetical protein CL618_03250 [archaeon]|nr:hypothetical protein [archaeon]|tara:strand:- start:602 stop:1612 length:1011 start_codon:yes stop_codon:yes gene_type:complete